jgi:hypothetical protein
VTMVMSFGEDSVVCLRPRLCLRMTADELGSSGQNGCRSSSEEVSRAPKLFANLENIPE